MISHTNGTQGPAAIVTRGTGIEAWHDASVAVVDGEGRLTHSFGDPDRAVLTRSALKPFQALALVTSGAAAAFALSSEELAIACASHSGTDDHVRVVSGLLAKAGATPADLQCGTQLPIGLRLEGRAPRAGEDQEVRRNACSGKHAGFLLLARHLGVPLADYLGFEAPVQRLIREQIALACEVDPAEMPWGIDGCSAPNYALPLTALARGMARLVRPDTAPAALSRALNRVRAAMLAHPLLVSGERRFDFELAQALPSNVVAKGGAEALEVVAVCRPELAFAVKIHDGSDRALGPVCIAVLSQLGILDPTAIPASLGRRVRPAVHNHRKIKTGEVIATLQLTRSALKEERSQP